jgi:urease accessory protein
MGTITDPALARLRLQQLVSPSLPIGGFTYSQGLEWAVECGWIDSEATLLEWTHSLLVTNMTRTDVPLLARLYRACEADDHDAFNGWSRYLLASRETRELRDEERNRGRAMSALLPELGIPMPAPIVEQLRCNQLGGFALASSHWRIPLHDAASGHLWNWLENTVLAGVKIIPLGQSAGQRIIATLTPEIPQCVVEGLRLTDDAIGASAPAQALASSLHEGQYTRIYRS